MPTEKNITFVDNPGLNGSEGRYMTVLLDVGRVLESWQLSLFSFEWMDKNGHIKSLESLPDREKPKRRHVEDLLELGAPLERPVLGIGIAENIEIGMGRAELLTLAAHGEKTISVHIPKSCESDFKPFRADVK